LLWRCDPTLVMAFSFLRFLDHTQRRTTVGRTSLDEWSARHRDLYLTTHNTHNRQTSMSPVGFEPTISAGERPQSYPLDRADTGTGNCKFTKIKLQWQTKRTKTHRTTEKEMEGTISFWGYKEQESNLILSEHDDGDDDEITMTTKLKRFKF